MNILVALVLILFAAWTYVAGHPKAALVLLLMGLFILYLS